jgi:hypothetical protein
MVENEISEKSKEKSLPKCSFCENKADTQEHVIPKWLQRHYKLFNQKMQLWNGTFLNYRYATIPACSHCNSDRFSPLEIRVEKGVASDRDLYLWALKLRYGLAIIDSRLLFDRKNPQLGYLLPPSLKSYKTEFITPALSSLENQAFSFSPDPFGSVFNFTQDSNNKNHFGLCDVPPPYWALSITLPTNRILAVLFADRGVTHSVVQKIGLVDKLQTEVKTPSSSSPQYILFNLLRIQNALKIPDRLNVNASQIVSEPLPDLIPTKSLKYEWYEEIAAHCGVSREIAIKAFNIDSQVMEIGYILWR